MRTCHGLKGGENIRVVPLGSMGRYLADPAVHIIGGKKLIENKLISCIFLVVVNKYSPTIFKPTVVFLVMTHQQYLPALPKGCWPCWPQVHWAVGPWGCLTASNVTSNVTQPSNSGQINYKIFFAQKISLFLSPAHFWGYFWSSFHTAIVISRISNEILTLAVPKYAIIPKINLLIYNQ